MTSRLVFEPNKERAQAEQRFTPLTGREGLVWLATASDGADLTGLPRLGVTCGQSRRSRGPSSSESIY